MHFPEWSSRRRAWALTLLALMLCAFALFAWRQSNVAGAIFAGVVDAGVFLSAAYYHLRHLAGRSFERTIGLHEEQYVRVHRAIMDAVRGLDLDKKQIALYRMNDGSKLTVLMTSGGDVIFVIQHNELDEEWPSGDVIHIVTRQLYRFSSTALGVITVCSVHKGTDKAPQLKLSGDAKDTRLLPAITATVDELQVIARCLFIGERIS